MHGISVRPVTRDSWGDFERLFEAKGCPHYCWCTPYRLSGSPDLSNAERKDVMRGLVDGGTPVGVLAYRDGAPVGWCSVAPRESYARLGRSRTMPRVTAPKTSTWVVLCFFVPCALRGEGLAKSLLKGAVQYARDEGAKIIEGYPFDAAGVSATHRGHSSVFQAVDFKPDGARWVLESDRSVEPMGKERAMKKPKDIDSYLASVPADRAAALTKLRAQIHVAMPGLEECISYNMPAFRCEGTVIAGFLATNKGCSYYPFSGKTLATLKKDLAKYEGTAGALHFDPERGLPPTLVKKLLKTRLAESR